jgi:hypothetical protein
MGTLQWLMALIGSSAIVGFSVRTFTKKAIEYGFDKRLETERFRHNSELQAQIEVLKHQLQLATSADSQRGEIEKARAIDLDKLRAESYPALVAILRRIKTRFTLLHIATSTDMGNGPINLQEENIRSALAVKALEEIESLERLFDDELSKVRIFTNRSDYALQSFCQRFPHRWGDETERIRFEVTDDDIRKVIEAYNDDIAYLSEEFYKPIDFDKHGRSPAFQLQLRDQWSHSPETVERLDAEWEGSVQKKL